MAKDTLNLWKILFIKFSIYNLKVKKRIFMNELASNTNKEGQLLKNEINKYKFFFSIQKIINKIKPRKIKP